MADIWSKKKRSEVMALIRSRGNKDTELRLAWLLRKNRISGWRRNQLVFGKPDFVFRRECLVVFVDGCFWHGCSQCYTRPKSNQKFWDDKFFRNRQRDNQVSRKLRKKGWRVVRIWEHNLKRHPERCINTIRRIVDSRYGSKKAKPAK